MIINQQLELKKLAEECGELIQICMKTSIHGIDNFNPKTKEINGYRLTAEMGDVLCHLKRVANAYGISWDVIQQGSFNKNNKVNNLFYKGKKQWEIK